MDYEQEREIRAEEKIRYNERGILQKSAAENAKKAERDEVELERLLEVKEIHGFWAAFLMRSTVTLTVGCIIGLLGFFGALASDGGTFWFRLWEGIKNLLMCGLLTMVVAMWKSRKFM